MLSNLLPTVHWFCGITRAHLICREEFASLYRFIETELTEENWRDLTYAAAEIAPREPDADKGPRKYTYILNPKGAARYPGLTIDIDLAGARAIQKRFLRELAAITRGDTRCSPYLLYRRLVQSPTAWPSADFRRANRQRRDDRRSCAAESDQRQSARTTT